MCLNYVQGGSCLIDGKPCLLGSRGNEARNEGRECPRHGLFDVWRTCEGLILISDLGGTYEGVTDCYGLGISLEEATKIAQIRAQTLQAKIATTERECLRCGARFWARGGPAEERALGRAVGYFCTSCLNLTPEAELEDYWKQIGTVQNEPQIDLSEWCG